MGRQTFDQSITFYVQCDCGELAKTVYGKHYFECSHCKRKYEQQLGDYVEMKEKASGS